MLIQMMRMKIRIYNSKLKWFIFRALHFYKHFHFFFLESLKSEKLFNTFKRFIYKDKNVSTNYEIIHYHGHIVSNAPLLSWGVDHFPGTDVSDVLHGWRHTEERLHGTSTSVLLPDRHTWHVQELSFLVERFRRRATVWRDLSYDAEIQVTFSNDVYRLLIQILLRCLRPSVHELLPFDNGC